MVAGGVGDEVMGLLSRDRYQCVVNLGQGQGEPSRAPETLPGFSGRGRLLGLQGV